MNVSHLHIKSGAIEKRPFARISALGLEDRPLKPLEGNPEIIPETEHSNMPEYENGH